MNSREPCLTLGQPMVMLVMPFEAAPLPFHSKSCPFPFFAASRSTVTHLPPVAF